LNNINYREAFPWEEWAIGKCPEVRINCIYSVSHFRYFHIVLQSDPFTFYLSDDFPVSVLEGKIIEINMSAINNCISISK
jgi:hypothetical protein